MKYILPIILLLTCTLTGNARERPQATAEDQFRQALEMLETADSARDMGDLSTAADLYRKALDRYIGLQHRFPDWQKRVVEFRIRYCNQQLESIMRRLDSATIDSAEPVVPGEILLPVPPKTAVDDSERVDFIRRAASLFLQEDKPREAREVLLEGLRISPEEPMIRLLLGIAQSRMGRHQDALFLMTELIDEIPGHAVARVVQAVALTGLGRTAEAEQQLQEAIAISPNLIEAHMNLAQLLTAKTAPDREAAARHYATARRLGAERDQDFERRLKELSQQSD